MTTRKKNASFEKTFSELEKIVEQLEAGDLTLEDSLKAFEKGVKLSRDCREKLSCAERKVQILLAENGEESLIPFEEDDQDEL